MLDLTKSMQTRDGRKVRVLCTNMKGEYDSVVGIVGDDEVLTWKANGVYNTGDRKTNFDLINVPEKRVVWVNMYPNDVTITHKSKGQADFSSGDTREACVRVECEVGQFDE